MNALFVDTNYWVARVNRQDQWHDAATKLSRSLGDRQLVTTDEVLVEFVSFIASYGPEMRREAGGVVRNILRDPGVQVVPQSRASLLAGLELFEKRLDKEYSLTDCISMQTMRSLGLTEVVSYDRHFLQEGFVVVSKSRNQ